MTFRFKTTLGIALIQIVIMVVLIFTNQLNFGRSAGSDLYDRAQLTARLFSTMVADAARNADRSTINAMIQNSLDDPDLLYLRVIDNAGRILAENGNPDALAQPFAADTSFDAALSDHRIDIAAPIRSAEQDVGQVQLGLSTLRVEAFANASLIWNLTIAAIGVGMVAVFGSLFGSVLTRQLSSLRDGARMIEQGNLTHRVPVYGKDELADTAVYFNTMAEALAKDRAALEAKQADLSERRDDLLDIVAIMRQIVDGKTLIAVPSQGRRDEIGEIARATAVFRNTMEETVAARREQARLIEAFDRLGEQVAIFDSNTRVIFANAAFRKSNYTTISTLPLSYSYEEFLRAGLAAGTFPDAGGEKELWIRSFRKRSRNKESAAELVREDGRRLLVRETDVAGVGMIVMATDITDLRVSQAQAVQASKLATLGEMAAGLAHELNQPLGVIRMSAGNMLRRIEKSGLDPDYAVGKLERIASQTERAATIINHMRIFARKDDQTIELFDLCEAVRDATTMMRSQFSSDDIHINQNIPAEKATACGSKVMFEQVVVNLLANARDAIIQNNPPDSEDAKHISVDVIATETETAITVADTGGGIPDEVIARLFEPFFTTKAPGKGTGLGLSISYGIIHDMGGEITVANTADGCEFTVRIPQATQMALECEAKRSQADKRKSKTG